ncbi:hypothetical protein [Nonomuraea sp. CA-141351]|uniref:hypothetical protein n=1 Tax=Nonomuraea sp. CA-141351 TaxID=3239996 RepID=UPI003D8F2DB3
MVIDVAVAADGARRRRVRLRGLDSPPACFGQFGVHARGDLMRGLGVGASPCLEVIDGGLIRREHTQPQRCLRPPGIVGVGIVRLGVDIINLASDLQLHWAAVSVVLAELQIKRGGWPAQLLQVLQEGLQPGVRAQRRTRAGRGGEPVQEVGVPAALGGLQPTGALRSGGLVLGHDRLTSPAVPHADRRIVRTESEQRQTDAGLESP